MIDEKSELLALRDHLQNGWHFFRKTKIGKQALKDSPWYLLLGPAQAGKSSLLMQSGIKFIDTQNSPYANWWFSFAATFLEVPGDFFAQEEFLTVLAKQVKQKKPAGIILTIDLAAFGLQNKIAQLKLAQDLSRGLYALSKRLRLTCPLYLIFTKADRIAGFSEFFADLGQEERSQTWGFDLPCKHTANLSQLFKTQFDRWLKRLYDRVIWRMHYERSPDKRALIQGFPLQLESFAVGLVEMIAQLTEQVGLHNATCYLQGVYFVSNQQQEKPIDFLQQVIAQALVLPRAVATLPQRREQQHAYFTQQLFKKIITRLGIVQGTFFQHANRMRYAIYGVIAALVIGSSAALAHNLNTKIANINAAEHAVTEYSLLTQQLAPDQHHDLSQVLPVLNALQRADNALQQAQLPWLVVHQHDVRSLVEKDYHNALITYFLPSLGELLAQPLANTSDPAMLYGALKTYLMLGDPSHLNVTFIKNWLAVYWRQSLANNPDLQKQLNSHLAALLAQPIAPLELNQQAMTTARNTLAAAPPLELAYVILKNRVADNVVAPFAMKNDAVFSQIFTAKNLTISSFYTAAQFQHIYFHEIGYACRAVINGDWVSTTRHVINEQELTRQLQVLYLQEYANHWASLLAGIQVVPWHNWQQAQTSLNDLVGRQSPLLGLLQTVASNTTLTKLVASPSTISTADAWNIKTNLSDRFQGLNILLSEHDGNQSLNRSLQKIIQLQAYIAQLANASDSDQAAFQIAKTRFTTQTNTDPLYSMRVTANAMPIPLRDWLNALADNSWRLILQSAAAHLDSRWQAEVLPIYYAQLNNRYPLFKNADDEIALDAFSHFFAEDGVLQLYVKTYLTPFMDSSKSQWQWRSVDGQMLNLTPTLLAQLERASIMRTMFFQDGNNLNIGFTLQAVAFEPGVHSFGLTVNGQTTTDTIDHGPLHNIVWPDHAKKSSAALIFTNEQGQKSTVLETGPWAIFKLLDQGNPQATGNPQRFLLTFDLNGNAAQYQLFADRIINPFLPGIIDQFRCPAKINF